RGVSLFANIGPFMKPNRPPISIPKMRHHLSKKKRHLDRSSSQPHPEQRSEDPPLSFAVAVACFLVVIPQGSACVFRCYFAECRVPHPSQPPGSPASGLCSLGWQSEG